MFRTADWNPSRNSGPAAPFTCSTDTLAGTSCARSGSSGTGRSRFGGMALVGRAAPSSARPAIKSRSSVGRRGGMERCVDLEGEASCPLPSPAQLPGRGSLAGPRQARLLRHVRRVSRRASSETLMQIHVPLWGRCAGSRLDRRKLGTGHRTTARDSGIKEDSWRNQFPQEATFRRVPTSAPSAATNSRSSRRRACRRAPSAGTARGTQ